MTAVAKVTAAVAVLALAALPGAAAGKVKGPGFSFKMKGVVGRWTPEAKAKPTYEYYLVEKGAEDKKATKGDGRKNAARMTQFEARRQCEAMGASLPSIHSADEHRQLIALLDGNKHGFWVGTERDAVRAKERAFEGKGFGAFYGVDTDNDNDAFDLELTASIYGGDFLDAFDVTGNGRHANLDTSAAYMDNLLPDEAPTGHGAKDKWVNLDGTAWNYDNWAPGEPSQDIDNFIDAIGDKRENCVYSGGGSRKNNGNPSLFYDAPCTSWGVAGTDAPSVTPRMKVICKREIDPPHVSHFHQRSWGGMETQFSRRTAMLLKDVPAGATSIEFGPIAQPKVQIGDRFIFSDVPFYEANSQYTGTQLDESPRERFGSSRTEEVYITGLDPVTFQPPLNVSFPARAIIGQFRRVRCSTSDDCGTHAFCFSSACWDTGLVIGQYWNDTDLGDEGFNVCDIVTTTFGNTDDGWTQADLQSTDPNWLCTAEPTTTAATTTIPAPQCAFPGFVKVKGYRGGKRDAIIDTVDADDAEQCYNECQSTGASTGPVKSRRARNSWKSGTKEGKVQCTHFAFGRSKCILYRDEPTAKTRMKHMQAYLPSSTCQEPEPEPIPAPQCAFPGFVKVKGYRGGKRDAIIDTVDADDAEQCYNECQSTGASTGPVKRRRARNSWKSGTKEGKVQCTHFAFGRRSKCILYRDEPTAKTRMKHMQAYLPSSTC